MRGAAAVLTFSLLLSTPVLAEPVKLSNAELDSVTAGVSVSVIANALALGASATALTGTFTKSRDGRFVDIAFGRGTAFARGSESAATLVDVSGEGDRVHTFTHTASFKTPKGDVSRSFGFVFAIEIDHDAIRAVKAVRP